MTLKRILLLAVIVLSLPIPLSTAQNRSDPASNELITDDAYHEQTVNAPRFKKAIPTGTKSSRRRTKPVGGTANLSTATTMERLPM